MLWYTCPLHKNCDSLDNLVALPVWLLVFIYCDTFSNGAEQTSLWKISTHMMQVFCKQFTKYFNLWLCFNGIFMFSVFGVSPITIGFSRHNLPVTVLSTSAVAVAVSAMMWTFGGTVLHKSLIWLKATWKSSPLIKDSKRDTNTVNIYWSSGLHPLPKPTIYQCMLTKVALNDKFCC